MQTAVRLQHLLRGVSFEGSFQFPAAERYYLKAIDEYAKVPEAWNALAQLHLMNRGNAPTEYATAIDIYQRGVRANPASGALAFDLCRAYYEIGHDYAHALSACRLSVTRDPRIAFAWDYAAWASVHLGKRAQAVDFWKRALVLAPENHAVKEALAHYARPY